MRRTITKDEEQAMSDAPKLNDPALVDNPFAPEYFAADAAGFYVASDGNVRITFTSPRVDHRTSPGPVNRVVCGRLVMPAQGALGLALGLYDFLQKNAEPLRQLGIEVGPRPGEIQ
jgi:hypothetical protein